MTEDQKIYRNLSDPLWRLNNLYSIVDKKSNEVGFIENVIQAKVNQSKAKKKIILKARQFGISTNEILKNFDHVCWNKNVTSCILAHEKDSITKLFRIVRRAHDFMHPQLRPDLDRGEGSKYEFYFPKRNSRIYCDLESRGDTINKLHVSEAAFIKDPYKVRATMQAVPIDGDITIESTPNGMNWFFDFWNEDNGYEKLFFPWYLHHEYRIATEPLTWSSEEKEVAKYAIKHFGVKMTDEQMMFRRVKKLEIKDAFIVEYPENPIDCFLGSGQAAMDMKKLHGILLGLAPPISDDEEGLRIYEQRDSKSRYVCGADTAEGDDGDYSVATIYNVETKKQCAVLRGHWKPADFAYKVDALCKMYQRGDRLPWLAVERNNHGHSVISELENHIHYPNLFQDADEKLGWLTNMVSRPIMMDAFVQGVESDMVKLTDHDTVKECLTLIKASGRIEADTGKHDDCVVASAIAVQLIIKSGSIDLYEDIGRLIRV
jgi:hypothetical protein